ncbi:hypothetical protein O1R50_20230 [Glycomyces luteolus]|uniref:Uncharacterized protein n=1 Tax=Glycomyces luteolus TaxID=2670330 RepID=A0A9X3PDY8_9ACTN|nr:hypothetical protein [Glycomyces luteolus]MDA1361967.1 hypothetical protein [Glycomyces luteolus]
MTVANDPDTLDAQGQQLMELGEAVAASVDRLGDKAESVHGCFGNGEIGRLMEEHHGEVLNTALDVLYVAAYEVQSAGGDLKGFAQQWRDADDAAKSDFGRIGDEMGGG